MKALAIFLFHSLLFISPFNAIKMDNHQLFLTKQQVYQESKALYEETLAQYQELHTLYQELPLEDPDRPTIKLALLKAKKGLKAFKPQLKMEKVALDKLFLALREEDIPKTDFLLEFALNAEAVALKARKLQGNIQKDQWEEKSYLKNLYAKFKEGKKLKVCRLIAADIKALVEQADNKPPTVFLEELAQIFERYDAVEKIKKYKTKSGFIESTIAPYVLSPNQLESILDQALAKDDFLTEEELEENEKELEREQEKADSTYRKELANFNIVLRDSENKILNQLFNMRSLEEQTGLAQDLEYCISAQELIAFLNGETTGHPLIRTQLINQLTAQLDSSKRYSIRELTIKIQNSLSLSSAFSTNLFIQEFYNVETQQWVQGSPPASKELYPLDWVNSCFDAGLRYTQVRREVAIGQLKEEIKAWFARLQPSINDPKIENYCLNKKQWKASIGYLFSTSTATGLKMPLLEDYFLSKIDQIDPKEDHLHMKSFIEEAWDNFLGDKDFQSADPFNNLLAEEIKELADSATVILQPAQKWEKAISASRCQGPKPLVFEPIDSTYNLGQVPITFSLQGEKRLTHFDKVTIGFPLKYVHGLTDGVDNSLRQLAFLSFDESKDIVLVGGKNPANMKIHSLTSDSIRCQRNGYSMDSYWVFSVRAEVNLFSILGIDTTDLSTLNEDDIPFYLGEEIRKYFGPSVNIGAISFDLKNEEIKIDYFAKMEFKLSSYPKGIESLLLQNHLTGPIKFNPIPSYGLKIDEKHKASLFWEQLPKVKK